jgi:hypothetical protein
MSILLSIQRSYGCESYERIQIKLQTGTVQREDTAKQAHVDIKTYD